MTMKNRPVSYVGVTGFMQIEEVMAALEAASPEVPFMAGVLASEKTLRGEPDKHPRRYPVREDIAGILPEKSARTLNLLHIRVDDVDRTADRLDEGVRWGGENLQGFQINACWPNPRSLRRWKQRDGHESMQLVLQVGADAMAQLSNMPASIALKLQQYEGVVEHVLIDGSCGTGEPLQSDFVTECFMQILEKGIDVGLGTAGGLEPDNLEELLGPIKRYFPFFSTDAEGRLHDEHDDLNLNKAIAFIKKNNEFFGYGTF